jgi:hypothetical protein
MNMIQGTFLFIIGDESSPFNVQLFDSTAGSGSTALVTNTRTIAASGVTELVGVMNIRPSIYVFLTGVDLNVLIGLDYT